MNKIILITQLITLFGITTSASSQGIECLLNNKVDFSYSHTPQDINIKKKVRVNVHFMQNNNGSFNFTEDGDGLGITSYTGYSQAEKWVKLANNRPPEPLSIPPNNDIPVLPRNIDFVLDAVYFHQSDTYYKYNIPGASNQTNRIYYTNRYNTFKEDPNTVIQIFYTGQHDGSDVVQGVASNRNHFSNIKHSSVKNYDLLYTVQDGTNPMGTFEHWSFINIAHEVYHLLGLSHTTLNNDGSPCSINANACNDGCTDTPTPYELLYEYNLPADHDCTQQQNAYCSNNYMDYVNGAGLTPCQLEIMHMGLDTGLKSYRVCDAVSTNNTLCKIGYPKISHFGKEVLIESCNSSSIPTLKNGQKNTIYFSKQIEIEDIEIEGNSFFEVSTENEC